jgi:hypothetical protein
MIVWTLVMQDYGLSINLQKPKMKVIELTQTKATPFQNGIPRNSLWYWFKCRPLELNIQQVEILEVCRPQGLTLSC